MGFGKDGKGVIIRESRSQTLGALAAEAGVIIGTKLATLERFRMLRNEVIATTINGTSTEGTGLIFGLADGQFTLAQIEAAIEADGPIGPNDTIVEDIADRPVWFSGTMDREQGQEGVFENEMGGHMLVLKPRWTFARTKSWNYFVYNLGATLTTGSSCIFRAKSFGVWVT